MQVESSYKVITELTSIILKRCIIEVGEGAEAKNTQSAAMCEIIT